VCVGFLEAVSGADLEELGVGDGQLLLGVDSEDIVMLRTLFRAFLLYFPMFYSVGNGKRGPSRLVSLLWHQQSSCCCQL